MSLSQHQKKNSTIKENYSPLDNQQYIKKSNTSHPSTGCSRYVNVVQHSKIQQCNLPYQQNKEKSLNQLLQEDHLT